MNVADAVIAAQWVGCKKVIGLHYDTFGFIIVDHQKAIADFAAAGIELVLAEIGSITSIS